MATLPQVSPQGGPNPNSAPQPGALPLPSMAAVLAGGARAAAVAPTYQPSGAGPGMSPPAIPLPSFDPSAPSLVQTPANGVMGQGTGLTNALDAYGAQGTFDSRMTALQNQAPGVPEAIGNWLFNPANSPAANAYQGKANAGATYARPEAQSYLSAHPSLLSHAESDPVGFATKLGPILDAAMAASNGTSTQGTIQHATPDGMMVKPDDNVEHTNAVAQGFGVTPQHAHAMTQPHHYTRDEFLAATEGLPRGALKNMWEMQHYINPQQQALSTALTMAQQKVADEQAKGIAGGPALQDYYQMLKIVGGIAPNLNELAPPSGLK